MWTQNVQIDDAAIEQMKNVAKLPFIHKHVAAMPDCHYGMGATVGSVIPTKGAIIPAAVGVDIGCGMMAWKLTVKAHQLPDNLVGGALRHRARRAAWVRVDQGPRPSRRLGDCAQFRRHPLARPR